MPRVAWTFRVAVSLAMAVVCATLLHLTLVGPAQSAVHPAGTLVSVGLNDLGQLGASGVSQRLVAGPMDALADDVVEMHAGREHGVALTVTGGVYTWGSNQFGQLGLGGGGNRAVPTRVPGLSGIQSVTTGHYHTLAIADDGQVWAWGYNAHGQLGDGTTTTRSSPVRVSGLSSVVALAAGRDMSYAVSATGVVHGWGLNSDGQVGDGTTANRLTPVLVSGLSGVTQLAGGRDHAVARRDDGSVWAWGWNSYGQLGDGTTTDRLAPVRVIDSGVAEVVAGAHHSYALRIDGTVASWGRGYRGALGDGSLSTRLRPGTVTGVTGAVSIGAGRDHGLAVLGDGRVQAWGDNPGGQLGDGSTTRRTTPVFMSGITDAVAASGGQAHSVVHVAASTGGGNQAPQARMSIDCHGLTCEVDGTASHDDTEVTAWLWDFGDDSEASGPTATRSYAAAGTYTVRLTVTDSQGVQDTTVATVEVAETPVSTVDFRAAAQRNQNVAQLSVTVPSAVQPGDLLVLVVTSGRDVSASLPAAWAVQGTVVDSDLRSRLYIRTAAVGTAGSSVQVTLGARTKVSVSLAAYADVASHGPVFGATRAGTSSSMRTPSVALTEGPSWVVSYWADKSSANTGWTVPPETRQRVASVGTGSGRVTAALADTGPLTGAWPGATAASTAATGKALAWTLVLR